MHFENSCRYKVDVAQVIKFAFDREENIFGKGENAG